MRVGLIGDIHGNAPALDAVLAELEHERVDRIVCLGDVAIGPQPRETVDRIAAIGCPVVMGNWDACLLGAAPDVQGELEGVLSALCSWAGEQLTPRHRDRVRGYAETVEVDLGEGASLLAFHGSPRSYADWILATTPDDELDEMLAGREATVLAGAHTHFQLVRRHGESLLVNAGSVGLAFRRREPGVMRISPWAEYGVVVRADGRLSVELRRTDYDVERFLESMRASGMPHADWWAELWSDQPRAVPTAP